MPHVTPVYATKGSHAPHVREILATVTYGPDGHHVTLYDADEVEQRLRGDGG